MSGVGAPAKRPSRWRSILRIAGLAVLAGLLVGIGLHFYRQHVADRELAELVRELDATDPGWRLEDLEAARVRLSDAENSAVLCREVAQLLGPYWPTTNIVKRYADVPVGELLGEKRKAFLEGEMARLEPARQVARRMVGLTRGRYPIDSQRKPPGISLADYKDTKRVASLFDYESLLQANKGDVSEAVRSARACICVGRSLYDEIIGPCASRRMELLVLGISGVERSLALGESNDAALAAFEALLAEEARSDTDLAVVRGERAWTYWVYSKIEAGELSPDFLSNAERPGLEWFVGNEKGYLRRQLVGLLRVYARAIEISKLPSYERSAARAALITELYRAGDNACWLAARSMGGSESAGMTARVAAMRGLIAVERYRMKYKKWPDKLEEIVPEFLKAVPTDPYDGKPIKLVKHRDYPLLDGPPGAPPGMATSRSEGVVDGVIVYSVGGDGVDDGGTLVRDHSTPRERDLGYQLWEVAKRRRPSSQSEPEEIDP